jgi:hypothetical protein
MVEDDAGVGESVSPRLAANPGTGFSGQALTSEPPVLSLAGVGEPDRDRHRPLPRRRAAYDRGVSANADATWDRLHALLDRYDGDLETAIASETAWSATLRLTLTNPDGAPSRSIAFYAVGGETPDDVARKVLDDAERWLAESDVEPLPPS